jgi:hypothetical protein
MAMGKAAGQARTPRKKRGSALHFSPFATLGALNLYLDFINMFQFLLSLIGNRD